MAVNAVIKEDANRPMVGGWLKTTEC